MVFRSGHDGEIQYDHFCCLLLCVEVQHPEKKIKTLVYYSKQHVDAAKGINEPPKEEFYTMKEAVQHFGMTEDQIYKYAKKAKVSKHMEGRIVLMNKQELDAALAPPSI